MKKQYVIVMLTTLLSVMVYGQNIERDRLIDVLNEYALNKQLKYEPSKTLGSPYLNKMFAPAVVSGVKGNGMMRYDAFADEFEFINSSRDTLVLNKVEPYTSITFTITNTKYQLEDYSKNEKMTKGYLILVYEKNNFSLFKKQNVLYTKERISKSGFDKNIPASFDRGGDTFYLKSSNGIYEFPSNRKGLIKLFPDKKEALEAFVKQNNIDFEKQSDIIKIVDFLST